MNANQILVFSGIAQVALTFTVAFTLFFRRVSELKRRRMEDIRASDNFKNLFEAPVLFYFLCAILLATQGTTYLLALLAWVFVGVRCAHSYIQCTTNKVMLRFYAFVVSTMTLLIMWSIFALNQINLL